MPGTNCNPFPATEIERALGPCADRPSIARASSVGCPRDLRALKPLCRVRRASSALRMHVCAHGVACRSSEDVKRVSEIGCTCGRYTAGYRLGIAWPCGIMHAKHLYIPHLARPQTACAGGFSMGSHMPRTRVSGWDQGVGCWEFSDMAWVTKKWRRGRACRGAARAASD
jgi:hypothetical protein